MDAMIKDWYYVIGSNVYGPMCRSEIIRLYNKHNIYNNTKVWKNGMTDWVSFYQTDLMGSVISSPLVDNNTNVNNTIVWIVAFGPLISIIVGLLMFWGYGESGIFILPFFNLIYAVLCIVDERMIKKVVYNTGDLFIVALIFIPAYLFMRANMLKQKKGYVITWCITFVVSLIISIWELSII